MVRKIGFSLEYFLIGLLFVIASLVSFNNPDSSLKAVVYVFAIAAVLKGIFELFFRRKLHEFTNQKSTLLMILGIFDLLIGVFLLFNTNAGLLALPYIFAIWFIVDSIMGLVGADIYKVNGSSYYWFILIVNIIGIIVGIMLLFNPIVSAFTLAFLVGFYLMMIGISLIAYAF